MRKIIIMTILLTTVFQITPAISVIHSLSVTDFITKRGVFCEIFVEPN